MTRGRRPGATIRTEGAWLATRHADGTTTREPLLTFDPFGLGRGRTHHRTLGWPRYDAWKRERMRFQRAMRAKQNGCSNNDITGEEEPMRRAG